MPLRRLLGAAANIARTLPVPDVVRDGVAAAAEPRVLRVSSGCLHIRVRGLDTPESAAMARVLPEALLELDGVRTVEVNGALGRLVVTHDEGVETADLIELVEEVERRHGFGDAPFAPPVAGDVSHLVREGTLLGAAVIGCGVAVASKVVRAVPAPPAIPALVTMADVTPWIRAGVERGLGVPGADLVFSSGGLLTQAAAQQSMGLALDVVHRIARMTEFQAHRNSWIRHERGLERPAEDRAGNGAGNGAGPGPLHKADPLERLPRQVPLPPGPVERLHRFTPVSIAAAAGTYAITRSAPRAQGVLVSGVPRAARLGREAFTIQLGRIVAGQGVVVVDAAALRRLDRIDTVVIDASALWTGRLMIDEVVPVSEAVPAEECHERAHELVDLDDPGRWRSAGGWSVGSLKRAVEQGAAVRPAAGEPAAGEPGAGEPGAGEPGAEQPGVEERAARLRKRGANVLALVRGDELLALVSLVPEPDPLAEALVAAARKAGQVIAAGTGTRLDPRLPIDRRVAGGRRLRASVRRLQKEGHGVALVSAREGSALAHADLGIGLLRSPDDPPWGAHLFCGPGLEGAWTIVDAMATAREVSMRSARIAAVGQAAGVMLAAASPPPQAARRALLAVNTASVFAFVTGTYVGVSLTRRLMPVPTDRTPWHAWPAQAVLDRLDSSPLGIDEAEAARRRTGGGGGEPPPAGLARITMEELDNPLTPPLAAGAGISAVVGSMMDAALIGTVLGVNAVMSGVQRVGADRALRQLVEMSTVRIRLRRPGPNAADGGVESQAGADQLVPGDVIALTAGDAVPADARLLTAEGLEVDESSLTGESQLVTKIARPSTARTVADRHSMLYQGTVVAAGNAIAAVVATGPQTEMGRTARLVPEGRRVGGVEARLLDLTRVTLPASLAAGAVLMGVDLLAGRTFGQALGSAVSLAVAAVPEGLPFVATAAELATARRLSRHGALVRNPSTVEALGRVDVLCFDKTGTLTEGRLRLRQVSDGVTARPLEELTPDLREIVAAALRAGPDHDGGWNHVPHPTDRAVVHAAEDLGMDPAEGLGSWERVDELHFEPSRGYHAVLGRYPGGQHLSVKGAPEIVLERCDTWRAPAGAMATSGAVPGDGVVSRDGADGPGDNPGVVVAANAGLGDPPATAGFLPFDEAARELVEREVERLARSGFRVLAVAERLASGRVDLDESRIRNLRFLGLLGIADPVRRTAAEAVDRLRGAGVQIVMITGDHPSTAEAIAAELGVLNGHVMTGAELDEKDAAELARELPGVAVFARVSPAQKARVVAALQTAGRVVAVTGDGANDAPAIRLADVGIALGERATPAARETADMVVTDDRIETITDAIADCRAMWRSARDAIAVLLGGNLGEIAYTVGGSLVSEGSPLNVRQLLLVNLLTDMLPALALAVRRPAGLTREDLLREGPETSLGAVLTRDITTRAVTTAGAAQTAALLGRFAATRTQALTTGLVALVGTQLLQTIAAGGRSPLVLASGVVSLAALVAIVQTPGLSRFFGSQPLLPHSWVIAFGSALAYAIAAVIVTRNRLRTRSQR